MSTFTQTVTPILSTHDLITLMDRTAHALEQTERLERLLIKLGQRKGTSLLCNGGRSYAMARRAVGFTRAALEDMEAVLPKGVKMLPVGGMDATTIPAWRAAGQPLTAVPGPSAVLAALAISGLPTDRFFFEGFLPAKEVQRRNRILELSRIPATLVLFETGPRLAAALADLSAGLGSREAAICRELTKLYEEVHRDSLDALAASYAQAAEPRGEIVIVIGPPAAEAKIEPSALDAMLRDALDRVSVKEAVAEIAAATGHPRRDVYQRALALTKDRRHGD